MKKLKAKESRLRERLDAVDTKNIERTLAIANAEDYVERSKHDLFFETLEWVISNPDFVDPDPDNKKLSQPKLDAAAKFLRECSDEPMLHEIADRWASTFLSDLNEICRRMARL